MLRAVAMHRPLDVSVVTRDSEPRLLPFLESLLAQTTGTDHVSLLVRDVGSRDGTRRLLSDLQRHFASRFAHFEVDAGPPSAGASDGHSRNLALGKAEFCLLLDVDLSLERDTLAQLEAEVAAAEEGVAAWELRRVPCEQPKDYDPVTGETAWCHAGALFLRRRALDAVGGFDERFAGGGADVDLSWRLRAAGFRVLYAPRAVAVLQTNSAPGAVRLETLYSAALANLRLRTRYGGPRQIAVGLARYLLLVGAAERFAGQRVGLLRTLARYLRVAPALRRYRPPRGMAAFRGWDYGPTREGAGYPLPPPSSRRRTPRVSVLVRTANRPWALREALRTVSRQTYPNIEVVVVEDGPPQAESLLAREFSGLDVVYRATVATVGRCAAGNLAMSLATGEYFAFLDDDDLLYADHVEALVDAVQRAGTRAAYALALEVPTAVESWEPYRYTEITRNACVVHRQPFSRPLLWHHNYMPIQSVLFHRCLYETLGGFDPAVEQLEDWDLWIRYSLAGDFAYAPKVTSRYRVPADADAQVRRHQTMARYARAIRRKQRALLATLPAAEAAEIRCAIDGSPGLWTVARDGLQQWLFRSALGRSLYQRLRDAYRRAVRPASSGRGPLGGAGRIADAPSRPESVR